MSLNTGVIADSRRNGTLPNIVSTSILSVSVVLPTGATALAVTVVY